MQLSSFDGELADALTPLVKLGMTMQVAPFHNTLCIGYHYYLAHRRAGSSENSIREALATKLTIGDWHQGSQRAAALNLVAQRKLFLFYGDATIGNMAQTLNFDREGMCGAIPVTRYKQCFVFIRRNSRLANFVPRDTPDAPSLLAELVESFPATTIHTDIEDCATALLPRLLPASTFLSGKIEIATRSRWPLPRETTNDDLRLFIYSSPSTAYMLNAGSTFIPIEIDHCLHENLPAYETHLIWFTPYSLRTEHPAIRDAITNYHALLFDRATKVGADREFSALAHACSDILAERHPSCSAPEIGSPENFVLCLGRHHRAPAA